MAGPFTTPVAESVPLENQDTKDNDFKALNVQEGMEEIDFRRETREPTGFIIPVVDADINSTATCSFTDVTRTFSLIPVGPSYDYFVHGCRVTISTTKSIVIPDTDGTHIIYLNDLGNLTSYVNAGADKPYDGKEIKVGVVYWNVALQTHIWFGDPRSELSMTWGTQRRTHFIAGTDHAAGSFLPGDFILNGDGSSNTHAQLSFTGGDIFHEDARWSIVDDPTPTNPFEQELSTIAQIPILYKIGAGNGVWRKKAATDFPLVEDAGNLIQWNEDTGGAWQLTNAGNNKFVSVSIFATIDQEEPIIGILHDREGVSPLQSINPRRTLNPQGLPYPAMSFLKVLIFQTSDAFTNTPKARLVTISDALNTDTIDRYHIKAEYGGNANTGRYLEMAIGEGSNTAPLLIPEDSFIRTITVQASATFGTGKKIGFFETGDLVTPVFEIDLPDGGASTADFEVAEFFAKGDFVAIRVTNGSVNKPIVRFWIETIP